MATICDKCGGNLLYSPVRKAMYCKLCGSTFKAEEIQDVSKADLIDKKILSFKELTGVDDRDLYNCNVYTCNHCGADILINGTETSTLCMFCGSPNIVFSRIAKQHKPEGIIPFTVSKEEAATILKARFKNAKFIPSELRMVKTENIRGIYIPYWVVNASFYSAYTIKTTEQQGKHHYNYYYCRAASTEFKSMPFDASTRLNDMLSRSLEPFWFEDVKVFDEDYLNGFYSDQSDLTPQGLRTAALKRMNDMVGQEVLKPIQGDIKEIIDSHPYIDIHDSSVYLLVPAWFYTFTSDGKPYTILINGQTGKAAGFVPPSKKKIIGTGLAITLAILTAFLIPVFVLPHRLIEGVLPMVSYIGIAIASMPLVSALLSMHIIREKIANAGSVSTFNYVRKRQG